MSKENDASTSSISEDDEFIEVTGCAARADLEELYLLTRQLARKHGLAVEGFELEPVQAGEEPATSDGAGCELAGAIDDRDAVAGSD